MRAHVLLPSRPHTTIQTIRRIRISRRVAGAKLTGHWSTSSPKKVSASGEALRLWVPEGLELVIIELVIIAAIIAARRQLCTVEVIIGLRRLQHDRLLPRQAAPGDGRTLSFLFGA